MQAQSDAMELTSEKGMTITSTEGAVTLQAKNEILLSSGGGYLRLSGGNIEVHGPGLVDVKGAQHSFGGPASMEASMPELPEGGCETQMTGADDDNAGAVAL